MLLDRAAGRLLLCDVRHCAGAGGVAFGMHATPVIVGRLARVRAPPSCPSLTDVLRRSPASRRT